MYIQRQHLWSKGEFSLYTQSASHLPQKGAKEDSQVFRIKVPLSLACCRQIWPVQILHMTPIYPEDVIDEEIYKLLTIYMQIGLQMRLDENRIGRRGGCPKNLENVTDKTRKVTEIDWVMACDWGTGGTLTPIYSYSSLGKWCYNSSFTSKDPGAQRHSIAWRWPGYSIRDHIQMQTDSTVVTFTTRWLIPTHQYLFLLSLLVPKAHQVLLQRLS